MSSEPKVPELVLLPNYITPKSNSTWKGPPVKSNKGESNQSLLAANHKLILYAPSLAPILRNSSATQGLPPMSPGPVMASPLSASSQQSAGIVVKFSI